MEILARLNPKHQQYDSISPGTKGDALTGLDVAAALSMAKLRPLAYQYALAKYALDERAREMLRGMLRNLASRKWGAERAEAVAHITIMRNVDPSRCQRCHGTGYTKQAKPCKHCDGTGVYRATNATLSRLLGIDRQNYTRDWESRIAEMDRIMAGLESQLIAGVRRALGERV